MVLGFEIISIPLYTWGMTGMYATITGRVQAVAYRAYVQDAATKLGLVGYVRNEPNGSVTVVAQGEPTILKELVEYLHEGSLLAEVDSVAVEWVTSAAPYDEFSIQHD
jgi:acylphosphatase